MKLKFDTKTSSNFAIKLVGVSRIKKLSIFKILRTLKHNRSIYSRRNRKNCISLKSHHKEKIQAKSKLKQLRVFRILRRIEKKRKWRIKKDQVSFGPFLVHRYNLSFFLKIRLISSLWIRGFFLNLFASLFANNFETIPRFPDFLSYFWRSNLQILKSSVQFARSIQ